MHMATQSIKKNIVIHDRNSATAFVEALEKLQLLRQSLFLIITA